MSLVYFNGKDTIYTDSILVLDETCLHAHKSYAITHNRHVAWVGDCGPAMAMLHTLHSEASRMSMSAMRQVPLGQAGVGESTVICVDYDRSLMAYWHCSGEAAVTGQLLPLQPLVLGYDDARHALKYALRLGAEPGEESEDSIVADVVAYHEQVTADASVALPVISLAKGGTRHSYRGLPGAAVRGALRADLGFLRRTLGVE